MIGSDEYGRVFGSAAVGSPVTLAQLKSMLTAGFSPVLLRPLESSPLCPLGPQQTNAADRAARAEFVQQYPDRKADHITHACGLHHDLSLFSEGQLKSAYDRLIRQHGRINIGVHLGRSGLIVVDADTQTEVDAFLSRFQQDTGEWPGQTVKSPGKRNAAGEWVHKDGGHWYFRIPDGAQVPPGKGYKHPAGFDVKWGDSYVVCPPSTRPEGPYRLVGTGHPAPQWLVTDQPAAVERAPMDLDRAVADGEIERWNAGQRWAPILDAAGWTRAGRYSDGCETWLRPDDGRGGSGAHHSAVAHDVDCPGGTDGRLHLFTTAQPHGLPEGSVSKLTFVAQVWHGGSVPTAMRSAGLALPSDGPTVGPVQLPDRLVQDFLAPAPVGASVVDLQPAESRGRVLDAMVDLNDLDRLPAPEPLIDQILDRSTIAVLAGKFGTYKTFLALDWAASVATGKPWAGHSVPSAVPVLYVVAEGATGMRKRAQAWTARHGAVPRGALTFITVAARLTRAEEVQQLDQALFETGAKFLVLDTLHKMTPGMEENSNTEVGKALDLVNQLRERNDVTILLVHHTGHQGERSRGGSAIEDDVDTSFVIKIAGEDRTADTVRTLHHRKSKDGELITPQELQLELMDGTGSGTLSAVTTLPTIGAHNLPKLSTPQLVSLLQQQNFPDGTGRQHVLDWLSANDLSASVQSVKDALKMLKK